MFRYRTGYKQALVFCRARSGAAAAEFGMTIMLLVIILIVAIEFGRLMQAYHVADKSVRDAARYLAQQPITCTAVGTPGTFDDPDQEDVARRIALTGVVDPLVVDAGTAGNPIPAGELIFGWWSNPGSILISIDCLDKTNGAVEGGSFQGGYTDLPFIPIVNVNAVVPFGFVLDLWNFGGFSVDHNQPAIF